VIRIEPLACADPLASRAIFLELEHRYLVWDAWTRGRRRVDLHPLVLSPDAHAECVHVARDAWALVERAAARAAADPVERARYGLHEDVERLASAAREAGDLGALVRVDLLLRDDGTFTACEVNADCPGGHNEALGLPRLARMAGLRRHRDPTDVATRFADRLVAMSGGRGSPRGAIAILLATAYHEDLQVCALVERLVKERGGRAIRVPPTAVVADGRGVSVRSERVAVLYRYYPTEVMAGQANVAAIAEATARGELASLSSFAVIHAQSKLAMARAFALDPAAAARTFPTTLAMRGADAETILRERASWVLKRDLSRVGDHVVVGELFSDGGFRDALASVAEAEREGEVWIAQRFVPQRAIATPWGPRLVTLGVYLLDGAFAGYFARLSATSHCTHDALAVPVFVEDASVTTEAVA
jgi:hypothetical protein